MRSKNPRGLVYGAAGAVAAISACASAMVLAPVTPPGSGGQPGPVLAARHGQQGQQHGRQDQQSFLQKEEAQGGDCTLTVPANPLSVQGLATPYQLANGPNTTGCTMANAANLGAFVQATILEPGGQLAVYDPLVVTAGTAPAAAPPVPVIPAGSVVTIDTGFNGNIDFLTGPGAGYFLQGLPGSPFGQVAAANGPAFFAAADRTVKVPALGTATDGMACPTTRDFSLVDQDQSDNVTAHYIVTAGGQTAELSSGVAGTNAGNGSDNNLLAKFVDPALGCTPFEAPDLSNPGQMSSSQALNELQARAGQQAPVALVPPDDPMTTVGADDDIIPNDFPTAGNLSVFKTDAYRLNVGQPLLFSFGQSGLVAAAKQYCQNLQAVGAPRLALDAQFEMGASPVAGMTLTQFLAGRFAASLSLLNCNLFAPAASAPATPATADPPPATPPPATPPPATPPPATPAAADPSTAGPGGQ